MWAKLGGDTTAGTDLDVMCWAELPDVRDTVATPIASASLSAMQCCGNCANYHDWNAKGVQSPYADLNGSRTVNDPDATNLMAILLAGSNEPPPVEHAFMPPFAHGHSDDELAAVANFVNGFFGNGLAKVTAADIDKARKALP